MIRIDHIEFEFAALDEQFAYGLYADWDDFCHRCFEEIVEECLSTYDKDKMLHEIERLDLNLGSIPEEGFYQEFPRRLKAELLKAVSSWSIQTADERERTDNSRLANLLFYLEHGYPKVEWMGSNFSLTEELDWAVSQQIVYTDRILKFCLKKEYVLRRLLWQTDNEKTLVNFYTSVLPGTSSGLREKRRFLELLLEMKPGIPVRFIHETADDTGLHDMAELLDTMFVRQIMETEAEEHAEVDLPPYWHYLYEWLVRYYPFNGLAVFGGKSDFIRHLHYRLLTFIHKRNYSFYLSKAELTVGFLLEVFGSAYYIEVLNAIYDLQPRYADGSPVYNGYLNKEMYGIFMQLSLLRMPIVGEGEKEETISGKEMTVYPASIEELITYLEDIRRSHADKRTLLRLLVKEKPGMIMNWLKTEAVKGDAAVYALLSTIAEIADDAIINCLLVSVSFRAIEVVEQVRNYLRNHVSEISWLGGVSEFRLSLVFRKSILLWIENGYAVRSESEGFRQLICLVCREITGGDEEEGVLESLSIKLDAQRDYVYLTDVTALIIFLKDIRRSHADKRMLLEILIKERPGMIMNCLQTEMVKENAVVPALVSVIAEITDDAVIDRMLAAVSFIAMEIALKVRNYLRSHVLEISWLNGISEYRLEIALRKSVLLWIGNGYAAQSESEGIRRLLRCVCREITGSDKEEEIERLSTELCLLEKGWEQFAENKTTSVSTTYIERLKTVLTDKSVPESVKRRMLALFLEKSKGSYADAVLSLYEQGLLETALGLTSLPVLEEIIKQSVIRINGTNRAIELLPLIYWLVAHESDCSAYLRDSTSELKVQLLVWLTKAAQPQMYARRPVTEIFSFFLEALFGKENIPSVICLISQAFTKDMKNGDAAYYDMETALDLLLNTGQSESGKWHFSRLDFKEWLYQSENTLNIIQSLLESRWNADGGFMDWLEGNAVSVDSKLELLQKLVIEKPQEWIRLLRKQPGESKVVTFVTTFMSASQLLQGMARVDFHQTSVLLQMVELLKRKADSSAYLTGNNLLLSIALSKALLLFMQDKDTLGGRTLTDSEIVYKYLSYLHLVYRGKMNIQDDAEWVALSEVIVTGLDMDGWQKIEGKEIADILLNKNDAVFGQYIISFMERQPERLLIWLEKDIETPLINRIVATSDIMMLGQWTVFLSTTSGFEYPDAFRRLMEWFNCIATDRVLVSDIVSVLLSWLKVTDWRKQTPKQMEDYFISSLFGANVLRLPIERIADTTLPENLRRRLLYRHIRFQPRELLDYIHQSVERNILSLRIWLEWLDINGWMRLATNLSLLRAELLQQIIGYLSESGQIREADLRIALATCLINNRADEWIYNSREETVRSFVQLLPVLEGKTEAEKENTVNKIMEALNITKAEDYPVVEEKTESPDILFISNAGLCLLAPWLPRLLDMLSYLDEDKRGFKDTVSKIRAIFLLQYLTCSEEKVYLETELAFNRLLVCLPMYIPLPESLKLTEKEKQIAENMLIGVKANWPEMNGTSVKGFQQSFITRTGRLEQQEERWLLTVDNRTLDILLDSVRWGFKQIRFPWMKKYVQVIWCEKQEF